MSFIKTAAGLAAVATLALGAASPSFASQQGRNTLLGGVAGGAAGAALSHGSVGGTLVGAAGGALIGNAVSHHHRHYSRRGYYRHGYR